jgi:hypothetical protein
METYFLVHGDSIIDCALLFIHVQPAPVVKPSPWPWSGPEEGGFADPRFRFNLTSLSTPQRRCIGFARRRVGRGGRYLSI